MLEVGTGSGFIAAYFSKLGYGPRNTHAVDVADERQVMDSFQFHRVDGVELPYADGMFDFVISNHVIEHVGSMENQRRHMAEIFRVLEAGGILYFAVPNRWRLIEPHYNLPLLSWLPHAIASAYMRTFSRGRHYDCLPLSFSQAENMLMRAGFQTTNVTLQAIGLTGEIEGRNALLRMVTRLPLGFWRLFMPIMPTLIFVCRKPDV